MRINHNIAALNTYRQLGQANQAQQGSMEKLSSGLRINNASDDAAGLAISEKMRGQIRGLEQAQSNAQDANSMIQTAEGAMNETHSILQRMRELATQSSNDTNTDADRSAIQDEITQLTDEIDRIAETTEFNSKKLINGDLAASKVAGTDNAAVMSEALGKETAASVTANDTTGNSFDGSNVTQLELKVDGANIDVSVNGDDYAAFQGDSTLDADGLAAKMQEDINAAIADYNKANDTSIADVSVSEDTGILSIESGSVGATSTIEVTGNATSSALNLTSGNDASTSLEATGSEGAFNEKGAAAASAIGTSDTAKVTVDGTEIEVEMSTVGGKTYGNGDSDKSMSDLADNLEKDINDKITAYNGTVSSDNALNDVSVSVKDGSLVVESGSDEESSSIEFDNSDTSQLLGLANQSSEKQGGGVEFQIGANEGQTMQVNIGDMGADSLGVANIDLSTQDGAEEAITKINDAIQQVSTERSNLGAYQNRLDHTINNLGTSSENLTAAESRIRDVDMAKEMMNQTKSSILAQASQAMLAQSQQMPQGVLQLLR